MKAIICAAGMGTRLGMNLPKALVTVNNKTIIERQLDALIDYDIEIIVGYKGHLVEEKISAYKNVEIIHNTDYKTTNTCYSIALSKCDETCLILDGDILIIKEQIRSLPDHEFIGICKPTSDMPVFADVNRENVLKFSDQGEWEWACIFKGNPRWFDGYVNNRVCDIIEENHLPIKYHIVDRWEIDTKLDLNRATEWMKNH